MADGEFAVLQTLFTDIFNMLNVNLTAANEHKPFIEHRIQVIKERVQAFCHTMPFKTIPKRMVANMMLCHQIIELLPSKEWNLQDA